MHETDARSSQRAQAQVELRRLREETDRMRGKAEAFEALLREELLAFLTEEKKKSVDGFFAVSTLCPEAQLPQFAAQAAREMRKDGSLPLPEAFDLSQTPFSRVATLYGQTALRLAQTLFPGAETLRFDSPEEVCSAVENENADGCLLPFSDADGLPFSGVLRFAEQAGLKTRALYLRQAQGALSWALYARTLDPDCGATVLEAELFPENAEIPGRIRKLWETLGVRCALPQSLNRREDEENLSLSCLIRGYGKKEDLLLAAAATPLLIDDCTISGFYPVYAFPF